MSRRTQTPEYHAWEGMKSRCHNPNAPQYPRYGGRGIVVCARWRNSFDAFLADMGRRPSPRHSVDRIDNDGPYAPGNCRWASWAEQENNRRNSLRVTINGETRPLIAWARDYGIKYTTVHERIRRGATPLEALTTPLQPGRRQERRS